MQQQAPAEHTAANTTGVTISKQATSRAHATENTTTPRRKCALLAVGLFVFRQDKFPTPRVCLEEHNKLCLCPSNVNRYHSATPTSGGQVLGDTLTCPGARKSKREREREREKERERERERRETEREREVKPSRKVPQEYLRNI